MSLWSGLVSDVSEIAQDDGEQVKITTASGVFYVRAMWEGLSLSGGEQGGPRMWVAAADLPSDFTQSNTVTYPATSAGTVYEIEHRALDGHGVELITLRAQP